MPTEIEAKMKFDDHAAIRAILQQHGARHVGDFFERNTFFDTKDRALMSKDQGLRLRVNRRTDTGDEKFVVTYKGARQPGALKSREEVEFKVSDRKAAITLFERLGYVEVLTFEKRRQSWSLGGCEIELDELPRLGRFVEIEGPDESSVMKIRELLKLSNEPMEKTGYAALISMDLEKRGDTSRELVF